MNDDNTKFGLSFLAGWLLGRRGRRRGGISVVLFIFGAMGLLGSCCSVTVGVPTSFMRSREVKGLSRYAAAELDSLPSGSTGLFEAQIPADAARGEQGLALSYLEQRPLSTPSSQTSEEQSSTSSTSWQRENVGITETQLLVGNGRRLTVQMPADVTFMNAEQITIEKGKDELRYTGFVAGQSLTLEGDWQGRDLLIAKTLFAGNPDAYVEAISKMPGQFFLYGLICGSISSFLLIIGGVLRFLGK